MSKIEHTEGPWDFDEGDLSIYRLDTMSLIAEIADDLPRSEARAIASLIAAAPELLEALKWMIDNDETNEGDIPLENQGGRTWDEINAYWLDGLNKARAALAKAEGRS